MSVPVKDATSSSSSLSASSLTFSHTCTGTDRALVVGAGERIVANSATYNSVSMTALTSATNGAANGRQFFLLDPATGANNVVVTFASSGNVCAEAISFTNCGGYRNNNTATGNSTAVSVTITSETNDLVVDYVSHGVGLPLTVGAGQTKEIEVLNANTQSTSTEAGAASVAMTWTASVASVWAQSGISLIPADEIRFDNSADGGYVTATSQTYSYTVTASRRNRLLVVSVIGSADVVTGITYNGVAMTFVNKVTRGMTEQIYYLIAPTEGANNVVVSSSSSNSTNIRVASYTGVIQTSPLDANSTTDLSSSTATLSANITVNTAGCWVMGGARDNVGRTLTMSPIGIVRNEGVGAGEHYFDSNGTVSTGTVTMQGTISTATTWAISLAAFKPAVAASGSSFIPLIMSS